ncbi:MAG: NAD(P)H-dependent oxidoreductase [Rhizobiales bacterium]|nr:NAD(P)H-dependent oxidoreductase [Hyphomicrobiales bacterium]MBI3673831.1 NAD(P)H-dependent oxidoreductase [Hyphomicrobiales bacterium]
MAYDVAVIVGSLRKDSLTRKFVNALKPLAPNGMRLEVVEIGDLPLYNDDWEADPSPAVTAFRKRIARADAVLFATPEYNRSVPGALKNAIDVGSRPYGKSVWNEKPAAVVSVSPGALSAFGANHHLRQALVFLNMPTLAQPEAYIGNVANLLDANGAFVKTETRDFIGKFLGAFDTLIGKFQGNRRSLAA